jgi:hypothetical protein
MIGGVGWFTSILAKQGRFEVQTVMALSCRDAGLVTLWRITALEIEIYHTAANSGLRMLERSHPSSTDYSTNESLIRHMLILQFSSVQLC